MVAFKAQWRTSVSMKIQNSISTSSSVSAIQYTPDLLFLCQRRLTKATKKACYTCTSISVFGRFSVDDRWKRKHNWIRCAIQWKRISLSGGKVWKCYFGGEIILLCFRQNENGDFWKYISMVGALHPSRIPRCSQTSVYRADQFAVSLFHTKSD